MGAAARDGHRQTVWTIGVARRATGIALVALAVGLPSACSGNPTRPSAQSPGLPGEWAGTTFQNRPISFTISAGSKLTAISIGYQIDSCSGIETFSNLDSLDKSGAFVGAQYFNFA